MLVLCEGLFQQNNSSLSWINLQNDQIDVDFFNTQTARLLGDTRNDMQRYGGKIYVVVNNTNTIEVLAASTGKSIKQISMNSGGNGKQPRSITFYGSKAFVSCYDGYVDVLDTNSLTISTRIQVGANPEGLAVSNGKLFVANSGGLNAPIMDSTVSVIDLATFQELTKVVVGKNPGSVKVDSQGDVYVIARGNYGSIPSRMVKIDPVTNAVVQTFTFDASGIEQMNDHFLISYYNYTTATSEIKLFNTLTESIENTSFISTSGITTLYGVQYNATTDKIYCLDAMSYTNTGYVRQYSSSGVFEKSYHVGLNPSKIIFYE
jgi:YVTN family beta-propeller protein